MTVSLAQLAKEAKRILADPVLVRKLGDRVYTLLQTEIRQQQDRQGNAPRRR